MKYFTIKELCKSDTATRKRIVNVPTAEIECHLVDLVDNVLDPLREAWGGPITVNSGYRCPALNRAVGGSPTSHHVKGMAADLTVGSRADNKKLFDLVLKLNLPFTQIISEKTNAIGPLWVHISYDPSNLKRQIIKL
jgi:uncharacterized protein YcbK (DUF882 family)